MRHTKREPSGVRRSRPQPTTDHRQLLLDASREVPPPTVGALATRWLERLERERCASLIDRQSFVRRHVRPRFDDLPIAELTFPLVNAYVCARRIDGYQPETLWTIGYSWAALCAEARIRIQVADLDLPRRRRTSEDAAALALTADEWRRLVTSPLGDLSVRLLARLELCTALRLGEAIGARWGDLERASETWWLVVAEQLHQKTGERRTTKDRAERDLPVRPELRAVLEEAREVYFSGREPPDAAPLALYVPKTTTGRLRAVADLRAWDQRTANKAWRAWLAMHDIAPRPLKAARHTLPGLLLEAGAPLLAVHSLTHPASLTRAVGGDQRGAFGRYVHVSRAARYRAVASLDSPQLDLPITEDSE